MCGNRQIKCHNRSDIRLNFFIERASSSVLFMVGAPAVSYGVFPALALPFGLPDISHRIPHRDRISCYQHLHFRQRLFRRMTAAHRLYPSRAGYHQCNPRHHQYSSSFRSCQWILHMSERIAYGQMCREGILKLDVEIMGRAIVIGSMKPISYIQTKHHHSDVNT